MPVGKEPADFRNGLARSVLVDGVAFSSQLLPVVRPSAQDAVEPQNGVKLRIVLAGTRPNRALLWIERIVGHHHIAYPRHLQNFADVRLDRLRLKKTSRFGQPCSVGRQTKSLQNCNYPASGFRNRTVFDE